MRAAAAALTAAGVPSAGHDARALMAAALTRETGRETSVTDLVLRGGDAAPGSYDGLVDRRVQREPLQLILGTAPVVGVDLAVGPGVFIPRPETDLLIEWAADKLAARAAARQDDPQGDGLAARLTGPRVTVLDLCSGPGTIALGVACLATRRGLTDTLDLHVIGLEKSRTALDYARRNLADWVERGDIDPKVTVDFHRADVSGPRDLVRLGLVAAADIVVSNPPYVPSTTPVDPEVAADPAEAVFSGADGLELMRPLAQVITLAAAPTSEVAVEHDDSTGPQVRALLEDAGVGQTRQHRDFAGRDRFVSGRVRRDPGYRPTKIKNL
ncbi:N5-glutamine methyltransferase family protein [Corynebacterium nuruki]|nr:HemK/PrmC family methyltransferase [Corynebacterium nuruki]